MRRSVACLLALLVLGSSLGADDHATAAKMFEQLTFALEKGDYDAFIGVGDADFRTRITRQNFEDVHRQLASRFKQGSHTRYVGDLKQHGCYVSLWVLSFSDGGDEFLCKLSIKDGKAAGFLIQ